MKGHFQNHYMRPTSPCIQNQKKTSHKKKPQAKITDVHRHKNPQPNNRKLNPTKHQKVKWNLY